METISNKPETVDNSQAIPLPDPNGSPFIEVLAPENDDRSNDDGLVEVYISKLDTPQLCGPLIKELSYLLPLRKRGRFDHFVGGSTGGSDTESFDLSHLRRVRKCVPEKAGMIDPDKTVNDDKSGNLVTNSNDSSLTTVTEESIEHRPTKLENESCSSSGHNENNEAPSKHENAITKNCKRKGDSGDSKKKKKKKKPTEKSTQLEILLGTVHQIDALIRLNQTNENIRIGESGASSQDEKAQQLVALFRKYNLMPSDPDPNSTVKRFLPKCSAQSKVHLKATSQTCWPQVYYHEHTNEHKLQKLALNESDFGAMDFGLREALRDGFAFQSMFRSRDSNDPHTNVHQSAKAIFCGCVVVCPKTKRVIARANDERVEQMKTVAGLDIAITSNPLCSSVILAIQGVSRLERKAAIGFGMETTQFRNGQYLCNGYDIYLTMEPDIYDSMALVHARSSRVIFAVPHVDGMGGLSGDCFHGEDGSEGMGMAVHCLPGTNHHYRVFRVAPDGDHSSSTYFYNEAAKLHSK